MVLKAYSNEGPWAAQGGMVAFTLCGGRRGPRARCGAKGAGGERCVPFVYTGSGRPLCRRDKRREYGAAAALSRGSRGSSASPSWPFSFGIFSFWPSKKKVYSLPVQRNTPWRYELSTHGLKRGRQSIYSIIPTNKSPHLTMYGERRHAPAAG